jgi:glutamate--cysteine ligase
VQTLTELAAELLITDQAFAPAAPGFVGTAVDLPGTVPGRRHLRHGFLATRAPGVVTVSGPPSPGIAAAVARMADDLRVATVAADGGDPGAAGVRVAVEAGLEGGGPHGLVDRWRLAHTLGPVLAAAFANAPGHGWRSVRQARHRDRPVVPAGGPDPWTAWAGAVLDAPAGPRAETVGTATVPHTPPHGWSFRQWTRATPARR